MTAAHVGAVEERKSFCRTCNTHCGMIVSVDAGEQIVGIRPDGEDLMTEGFACFKGLVAAEAHQSRNRVLHPLKRQPDGTFQRIGLEQALDEIAAKLEQIIARDGSEAVGGYRGSGAGLNASGCFLLDGLFNAIGTPKVFSAITIDQSAKIVAAERIGVWPPGPHPFVGSDVTLIFGANPLISYTSKFGAHNPRKRLKEEIAKGSLKVLVVDPRRTETARFADVFLQPMPGEDATIAAGMIRLVLEQGWEDKAFVAQNVSQVEQLRQAVQPFTPGYVARRADVPVDEFLEMTRIFALAKRGRAQSGTGANMGPHSNLVEHLLVTLNILCGRFVREGERIANPGVLMPRYPRPCQVRPAKRSYQHAYQSRIGDFGALNCGVPELPTGIMADEILQQGRGQIKAFIAHGGNPAVIVPDQLKVVRAFRSLELLVTIDPYMTPTAKLSHYVLPTVLQYERADLPCWQAENIFYNMRPYTRYTPAVSKPPPGAEVAEDVYIFWGLAKRLGLTMTSLGVPLDMTCPPTADDLLSIVAARAHAPYDDIRRDPLGGFYEGEPQFAERGNPGPEDRFTVAPPDVVTEIGELAAEDFSRDVLVHNGGRATHRLTVRRQRHMWNSIGRELPSTKRHAPFNAAVLNPQDLADMGASAGDLVRVSSETVTVEMIAEADVTLRRGVISVTHGYGVLPEDIDFKRDGVSVNIFISTDANLQTINAMPRMTSIPVAVAAVGAMRCDQSRANAAGDHRHVENPDERRS
jgi:anaerobic selenocysteine-containing dehydrogenase